jgi:rfaE bifunctional protein kinase chain/domain
MNNQELLNILNKFKDQRILVIGDLILDKYIEGNVKRISPEAPVMIVNKKSENCILGGAANVAANITSLSGEAILKGFIGKDKEGEKIITLAKKRKIKFIPEYNSKTTKKTRITSENQQLLRIDDEDISPKFFNFETIKQEIEKADLVVISDYGKGVITSDLMKLLENKKTIVDPKPKNKSLYSNVFLLTPNTKEALEMSGCTDVYETGEKLKKELSSNIIITRGKEGMSVFNNGVKNIPTYAKEVYDVTGAGDTVIATIGLALASGANLNQAAIIANYAAGIVVAKYGTSKVNFLELKNQILKNVF